MKRLIVLFIILLSVGCKHAGVKQVSDDVYFIHKKDHSGIFGDYEKFMGGVIEDANEFAKNKGKIAIPIKAKFTPIDYNRVGGFAYADYNFILVDKDSEKAKRAVKSTDVYRVFHHNKATDAVQMEIDINKLNKQTNELFKQSKAYQLIEEKKLYWLGMGSRFAVMTNNSKPNEADRKNIVEYADFLEQRKEDEVSRLSENTDIVSRELINIHQIYHDLRMMNLVELYNGNFTWAEHAKNLQRVTASFKETHNKLLLIQKDRELTAEIEAKKIAVEARKAAALEAQANAQRAQARAQDKQARAMQKISYQPRGFTCSGHGNTLRCH